MNNDFLPFSKPCISQAAIDEVVDCIKSGWLATGPRVQNFEQMLRDYFHAPHALTFVSATGGLHLTLMAFLKPGDEVITTPMTFVASANTIALTGAKPVFVDVELSTYNMDVSRIEKAITPKTRAIMPVHFAGLPVDLDPLYAIAEKHGLRVLEDAAQAVGTHYKGRVLGSFGDTQAFSFHPNKVITTGEGGCITTRDDELAKTLKLLKFHGIDRDSWNRYGKEGSQHFDVPMPGFKYNMMDMQAALGLHQLPELEGFIQHRTKLANRYKTLMADWPEITLPGTPNFAHRHSWYIFTPLINPEQAGMTRDTFMQKMKEHNIGTGLHHTAVHLFSYYQKEFGYKAGDFPNAESIGDRIVSLPLFSQMTEAEQDRVIQAMKEIFRK